MAMPIGRAPKPISMGKGDAIPRRMSSQATAIRPTILRAARTPQAPRLCASAARRLSGSRAATTRASAQRLPAASAPPHATEMAAAPPAKARAHTLKAAALTPTAAIDVRSRASRGAPASGIGLSGGIRIAGTAAGARALGAAVPLGRRMQPALVDGPARRRGVALLFALDVALHAVGRADQIAKGNRD